MAYRVLVVEDDFEVRWLLCDLLGEAGYQVESAGDGVEALQRVIEHLPDLVLSDVIMPRMSGLELCALLKENPRTQQLPVIFLTCVDDPVKGFEVGADDFISKPFRAQELLARVQALLRRASFLPSLTTQGLRGNLTDLSLLDLVQALHIAGASGCLTVVRPQPASRARLWLTEGALAAAVLDSEESSQGREALFGLSSWTDGLFSFDSTEAGGWQMVLDVDEQAASWGVYEPLEGLLLEATRLKDERDRLALADSAGEEAAARPGGSGRSPQQQARVTELARKVDEVRNRLKIKAFQAMIEGRMLVTSGVALPAEPLHDVDLPPELDQLIERMLDQEP